MTDITSPTSDRIKAVVRLDKRSERDASGLFVIEGRREVERAIDARVVIETLFVAPDFTDPSGWYDRLDVVVSTSDRAFRKMSHRRHPDGVLAVARQWPLQFELLAGPPAPLYLVADGLEKPGNLGAILRTAESAGIDGVILADARTDVFNPNVVRASQGALFSVPIASSTVAEASAWLEGAGVTTWAATPDSALSFWDADFRGPTAIVVGAEDVGLTPGWSTAVQTLSIPQRGVSDSLNASVAAGILVFEAVRQRRVN